MIDKNKMKKTFAAEIGTRYCDTVAKLKPSDQAAIDAALTLFSLTGLSSSGSEVLGNMLLEMADGLSKVEAGQKLAA